MTKRKDFVIDMPTSYKAHAKVGNLTVGLAVAWEDCDGRWVIMESFVQPRYRRRGIASAMYRNIEQASGKQLTPAISLSDDAFQFWQAYRPEAVALDLRHRPELIGRKAVKNGRTGKIIKASGGVATMEFDDGDRAAGTLTCIRRDELENYLV